MADDLNKLVVSTDRRRRAAIFLFAVTLALAALLPHNDRAMWVPESRTTFVFNALPEDRLPLTYLTIPGADNLLRLFSGTPERRRQRFLPRNPVQNPNQSVPANRRNNIPEASVPDFESVPEQLASANNLPALPGPSGAPTPGPDGSPINGPVSTNPGGGGGIFGGGPFNDPDDEPEEENEPGTDDPLDEPPVMAPVPEPMTWVMMLSGFLLMGAALRRRRKVQPAG